MSLIKKSKFPNWYIIVLGLIHIAEGLFIILTFGNFTLNLSLKYVMNYHRKIALQRFKQQKINK